MKRAYVVLLVALAAGVGACRQADGPIPAPADDKKNEIGDIARDIVNITNKDPEGAADLAHDLERYTEAADARARSQELARRLSTAVAGGKLDDQSSQRLAHTIWIALTAPGLSQRQVKALQDDVKAILTAGSVAADRAQPVVDQLGAAHDSISTNPKRWYHLF